VAPFQAPLYSISMLEIELLLLMSSFNDIFAYYKAFFISGIISFEWCYAVYLGRKPVPGGVTNVFLGFE
jgi:hypothetical protein